MPWKDTTSYSRHEKDRVPTCWSIEAASGGAKLRVAVLNSHRFYPGEWMVQCFDLGINECLIGKIESMTEQEAKAKAISVVQKAANDLLLAAKSLSV